MQMYSLFVKFYEIFHPLPFKDCTRLNGIYFVMSYGIWNKKWYDLEFLNEMVSFYVVINNYYHTIIWQVMFFMFDILNKDDTIFK